MTLYIASITQAAAYLSQDSAACNDKGNVSLVSKISVLPTLRLAVGGSGDFGQIKFFADYLSTCGHLNGIEDVNRRAHGMISRIIDASNLETFGDFIVVGWSEKRNQPTGYIYSESDGYFGQEMTVGAHTFRPDLHPQDRDYDQLSQLWREADETKLLELHRQIAINQYRTIESFSLPPVVAIGGDLITAQISRSDIRLSTIHRFPNFDLLKNADWDEGENFSLALASLRNVDE